MFIGMWMETNRTKDVKNACRVFDFLAADPEFAGEGTSVSGIPREEEYLWKFLRVSLNRFMNTYFHSNREEKEKE
jgi:hypothetical protein